MNPSPIPPRRKVAFFGSPAWAVPVAQALHQHHNLVLVVTQPDKPAGRGLQLTACPVAQWAEGEGLRLEKPTKIRKNQAFFELCRQLELDAAITAAYGKILPGELLDIPPYGFLNLHPSDLPKYRGPAPVQWTLINGDHQTAVSIMKTDVGMDTGPVIAKVYSPVDPHENAQGLSNRLRDIGIEMLLAALQDLEHLNPQAQPLEGTHAPMLEKDHGRIVWTRTAQQIYNRHRGVQPWPGSWFEFVGKRVKVLRMGAGERGSRGAEETAGDGRSEAEDTRNWRVAGSQTPGWVIAVQMGVEVAAAEGVVELLEVQPEGKKPMSALDWARGYQVKVGTQLD